MKLGNEDVKLYLGDSEVEKIYLGTEQVYGGGSEPEEPYRFKLIDNQGNEYVNDEHIDFVDASDIDGFMVGEGISPENIVELQIGDYVTEVNDILLPNINNFYNVSGITVGKNVTEIGRISDAQTSPDTGNIELQWIKLKCKSIPDITSHEHTFENTNCCPILVRSSLMIGYRSDWSRYTDYDCGALLSDRIGTYEEITYEEQYLTFVAEADNCAIYAVDAHSNVFQYSVDSGRTWNNLANNASTTSVNSGQTIMFKAYGLTVDSSDGIGTLRPTASASVQGNVMSLVYGDDFIGRTDLLVSNRFMGLFYSGTGLTSAENLILPALYLTDSCYRSMFTNCTSLTTAPVLPATTLATYCYYQMFRGCTSLNYIKCLATDISAPNSTYNWVYGVANSGTFVKAASMSGWYTGTSGIPTGWTIQNDDGSPVGDNWDDQE